MGRDLALEPDCGSAGGAPIAGATVALMNSWDRTVSKRSADHAGELLWANVPFGDDFVVSAPGFYSERLAVTICDSHQQTIGARLERRPERESVIGSGGGLFDLDPLQMPNCQNLDLPHAASPKGRPLGPSKRK
jgi:hypothetical protein